jgi:hypothetical protein
MNFPLTSKLTVLALPDTTFSEPFNSVEYLPTTIFIDKNGLIRLACTGTMTEKEIRLALKALESPSSTPSEPNSAIRL